MDFTFEDTKPVIELAGVDYNNKPLAALILPLNNARRDMLL
jgi:hypothetical protein